MVNDYIIHYNKCRFIHRLPQIYQIKRIDDRGVWVDCGGVIRCDDDMGLIHHDEIKDYENLTEMKRALGRA